MKLTEIVRPFALCNPPTLLNTVLLAERAIRDEVPGDMAECGVYAGAQPALMADAMMRLEPDGARRVHLFDSFAGIPEAGPRDDESITGCIGPSKLGRLISSGVSVCTLENVRRNMNIWGIDPARLVYYKGWFQETVPAAVGAITKLAVLRLDGDLYESTAVCLKYLHPLVQPGGWVIIDDYALTGCHRAVDEYHKEQGLRPEIFTIDGGGGPVYYQVPR